jgi:hypothetical protein
VSSAADKARAKAARIAANSPADPDESSDGIKELVEAVKFTSRPLDLSPPPVGTKPIRISLDLAPALFDQLTEWRTKAARQLGRGRVTNADALRVLVRMLMADDQLTARVIDALRRESST